MSDRRCSLSAVLRGEGWGEGSAHFGGVMVARILLSTALAVCIGAVPVCGAADSEAPLDKLPNSEPRNIVLILADDHRYDALGFLDHPFLETPHLDSLAK